MKDVFQAVCEIGLIILFIAAFAIRIFYTGPIPNEKAQSFFERHKIIAAGVLTLIIVVWIGGIIFITA